MMERSSRLHHDLDRGSMTYHEKTQEHWSDGYHHDVRRGKGCNCFESFPGQCAVVTLIASATAEREPDQLTWDLRHGVVLTHN